MEHSIKLLCQVCQICMRYCVDSISRKCLILSIKTISIQSKGENINIEILLNFYKSKDSKGFA